MLRKSSALRYIPWTTPNAIVDPSALQGAGAGRYGYEQLFLSISLSLSFPERLLHSISSSLLFLATRRCGDSVSYGDCQFHLLGDEAEVVSNDERHHSVELSVTDRISLFFLAVLTRVARCGHSTCRIRGRTAAGPPPSRPS